MGYRLTQKRGSWLENAKDKTRESAPPLIKQIWEFFEEQLEVAESRDMTVGRFFTAEIQVTIGGFWREHAKGELKTRKNHEILRFLSPCWEKRYMGRVFYAGDAIFDALVQELLNMPINLLLALYLVYPRYLFNMGPAYMFSRGVETLRIDGYLTLVLFAHGELMALHRLMKYGGPLSMRMAHPTAEIYSYESAAGLKTLLVEYLLMQSRHLTDEERDPKTREELKEAIGGMPLLTDLCLAIRSDPLEMIRGLGEVVTCIYGPAVTYAFPDPLMAAYRNSVVKVSLISFLDGAELVQARRAEGADERHGTRRESEGPRVDCVKLPGTIAMQNGGKPEGPIESYPKFWNLNPPAADKEEFLRIPLWKGSFELVKKELEMILEREVLLTAVPKFPMVRRMTLGMNSPLRVPSIHARATIEKQQKEFTDSWDPLFIGYSTAVYFHTYDIKINSWTTRAKKMRGSMSPKFEVRDILRTLEEARLENKLPISDDGRMIVEEEHIALRDE